MCVVYRHTGIVVKGYFGMGLLNNKDALIGDITEIKDVLSKFEDHLMDLFLR
ncbi:MAG: hypothetical protein GY730_01145 [bacterium]|nr:hypothetical protein [bacterium]